MCMINVQKFFILEKFRKNSEKLWKNRKKTEKFRKIRKNLEKFGKIRKNSENSGKFGKHLTKANFPEFFRIFPNFSDYSA